MELVRNTQVYYTVTVSIICITGYYCRNNDTYYLYNEILRKGISMNRVEFICSQFAILSDDGNPCSDKYHLRDLLALKSESRDFLLKQAKPFLEKYGVHYRVDVGEGFPLVLDDSIDESSLQRLGFSICSNETGNRRSKMILVRNGDTDSHSESDNFLVPIDPVDTRCASLFSRMGAAAYVARLGLMSATGEPCGLDFEHRDRHGESYRFTLPEQLAFADELIVLDEVVGEGAAAEPMHARLRRIQGAQFELTFSLVRTWELQPNGMRKTVYFDFVPVSNGETDSKAANMMAADLLLIALSDMLRHRVRSVRIAPGTLRLSRASRPTLIDDLIDNIASGRLHACPNCGRPLIGNSFYCKFGACAQRYNERARAAALVGGMSEEEIREEYPFIQPQTVSSWFA